MINFKDNKNKVALALTVALIIILFSLCYNYWEKNQSPKKMKNEQIKENQIKENRPTSNNINSNILNSLKVTINKNDCDKENNQTQKASCENLAAVNSAMQSYNYGNCDQLDKDWQDICIYKTAVRMISGKIDQSDKCNLINGKLIRSLCFKSAAIMLNDEKLCDKDEIDKEECMGAAIDYNNQKGLAGCEAIRGGSWFYTCVIKNSGNCSIMKDKEAADKCQSWQIFDKIIAGKNGSDCSKLPLDIFKKVCETKLSGKGSSDSNSNGVSDYEELTYGFNPLIENDSKNVIDNQKLVASFSSNIYEKTANNLSNLILTASNNRLENSATNTKIK
jgi:hypothetical protein